MVLAGSDAKQVQWTNVYQDALVRPSSHNYYHYHHLQNVNCAHSITNVLLPMMVVFVGSWHGYNWNFACVQSHHEGRLAGDVIRMFILK